MDEEWHCEVRDALEERGHQDENEGRHLEQRELQHRLPPYALDKAECDQEEETGEEEPCDAGRKPHRGLSGHGPEHEEESHSEEVDAPRLADTGSPPNLEGNDERGFSDGEVYPEDPTPLHIGDEDPAEDDTEDCPEVPSDRVEAVGAPAPHRREDVNDHRT